MEFGIRPITEAQHLHRADERVISHRGHVDDIFPGDGSANPSLHKLLQPVLVLCPHGPEWRRRYAACRGERIRGMARALARGAACGAEIQVGHWAAAPVLLSIADAVAELVV